MLREFKVTYDDTQNVPTLEVTQDGSFKRIMQFTHAAPNGGDFKWMLEQWFNSLKA